MQSIVLPNIMDTYTNIEKQEPASNSHIISSLALSHSQPTTPSTLARCQFAWKNISYSIDTPAGKKQILTNVDGCVEKGSFEMPE